MAGSTRTSRQYIRSRVPKAEKARLPTLVGSDLPRHLHEHRCSSTKHSTSTLVEIHTFFLCWHMPFSLLLSANTASPRAAPQAVRCNVQAQSRQQ
jgi:hypothetical protein